ncbi:MAG: DNA gyrase subunit A, partial [Clostridiaceae bacterium]|nr:DNA gyrase subunit A [Clostridiaceae bacterium]
NLLHLDPDERVRTFLRADTPKDGDYLVIATRQGMVKKTELSEYSNIYRNGLIAINLREDDRLTNVRIADDHHDIILVTRNGMSIRFPESSIRPTGRNTMGVRGIRLDDDDEVIGMITTDHDDSLLVVTENGYGKRSRLEDYRPQNRSGKGLITYKVTKKTGKLVGAAQVNDESEILIINDQGIIIRIPASEIPIQGRNTSGVTLMRSRDGKVVDMSIVIDEEDDIEYDENPDQEADIDDTDSSFYDDSPSENEMDQSAYDDEL